MKIAFEPFCTTLNFTGETASCFYSSQITPLHAHNTLQLVIALKGKFLFRTAGIAWGSYSGVIIRENIVHQLNTNQGLQLIIYIEPAANAAQKLKAANLKDRDFSALFVSFSPLEEALIHKSLIKPEPESSRLLTQLILDRVASNNSSAVTDERIIQVLNIIGETQAGGLSIEHLASRVFISPSRLRMQFKQLLGVSLHQYIIRHKVLSAITGIVNGLSVQDSAYNAGFTDSSHLSKLMIKLFAVNPSMFLKENQHFSVVRDANSFELKTALASPF